MKVYVGNLPFTVDSEKLKAMFASYGDIEEATVISDKFSGRSKGFGFVTFQNDESAKKAVSEMNDKEVEGRALKVNEARPMEDRPPRREGGNGGSGGGFNNRRRF
ncbi:MAG: RNA-binding protein [Nanoarchaeota archaeon]|nr:RNA-binding protein [Nanoarchaeota archaeon]MBU2616418.1 RNA-binding protein [Nanoarchaeota archaeon]